MDTIIEQDVRLSTSKLWDMICQYYQDKGITAWSKNYIPYEITSNNYIGKYYANLIGMYVADLIDQKTNPTDTLTIFEMGLSTAFSLTIVLNLLSIP